MAKRTMDLSSIDQENLQTKINEWKKVNSKASFYYRPAAKTNELTDDDSENNHFSVFTKKSGRRSC